jgi:hypothetical protein
MRTPSHAYAPETNADASSVAGAGGAPLTVDLPPISAPAAVTGVTSSPLLDPWWVDGESGAQSLPVCGLDVVLPADIDAMQSSLAVSTWARADSAAIATKDASIAAPTFTINRITTNLRVGAAA